MSIEEVDNKSSENYFSSPSLSHRVYTYYCQPAQALVLVANKLGLAISKTRHRAIQVDGKSVLNVIGEASTIFKCRPIELSLSALVVSNLGTDFLCGTDFHKTNDVYSRLATDTITLKGSTTVILTPPMISDLDQLGTDEVSLSKGHAPNDSNDTRQRLLRASSSLHLPPGEPVSFVPLEDIEPDSYVQVKPNCLQSSNFFQPCIVQACEGVITVENQSEEVCHG